jgi:hypothetical protein
MDGVVLWISNPQRPNNNQVNTTRKAITRLATSDHCVRYSSSVAVLGLSFKFLTSGNVRPGSVSGVWHLSLRFHGEMFGPKWRYQWCETWHDMDFVRETRLIYMLCFKYCRLSSFCPTLSAPYNWPQSLFQARNVESSRFCQPSGPFVCISHSSYILCPLASSRSAYDGSPGTPYPSNQTL